MSLNPFVLTLIFLDICAAVFEGCHLNWAKMVYWIAAGLITGSTLFMK